MAGGLLTPHPPAEIQNAMGGVGVLKNNFIYPGFRCALFGLRLLELFYLLAKFN